MLEMMVMGDKMLECTMKYFGNPAIQVPLPTTEGTTVHVAKNTIVAIMVDQFEEGQKKGTYLGGTPLEKRKQLLWQLLEW